MKKLDRLFHSPGPCHPSGPGESPLNYHLIQDTPIGDLAIVYRAAPFSVHRILLPNALVELLKSPFFENGCTCSTHPENTQISRCILDYLQGNSASPGPVPWPRLYLKGLSPLQVQVLRKTAAIPYGRTVSYKAIAEAIGRPRAYRFVGTALAVNPFPILIPCHRVIRSDASLGEYGGGRSLKQWLLGMESQGNCI